MRFIPSRFVPSSPQRRVVLLAVVLLASLASTGPASAQECFIGEVRMFAGNFAPRGWALCDGQLLAVSSNTALFSVIGTTYGGDGRTTFALPDLRSRAPVHAGQGPGLRSVRLGERFGAESVTLTQSQLPSHNHPLVASDVLASETQPTNTSTLASKSRTKLYTSDGTPQEEVALAASSIGNTGGSQPVSINPPSLGINYIICLQGVFPSRN